ncbi:MAG: hypothetical protein E6J90_19240 [Deltaproteobacteria bacterium]|nr:MAG: hypothetical protein E6J90_19240 [Deltaproteobacteria bacterium]TMQ22086.1 MAG: hypothetical protein E6J91_01850 [Deltaproteobacteria bacterium]
MFKLTFAAALSAAALLSSSARADRRAYGTTYEAVTAPRGELDVETWTTFAPQGEVDGGPSSRGMREMIELEYGITDRWDAALYNMLDVITAGDSTSGYAGFKIETRYRPSDRGQWPIDPVFYLEFQQLFRGDARQKYEAKLILAKDIGNINIAANLALEEERTTEPAWNTEVEYAVGSSYALSPAWLVGAELFGKAEKDEMGGIMNRSWAGPTVSWAGSGRGVLHGVWVTLAGGAGLTGESDAYYARAIVGFQFR